MRTILALIFVTVVACVSALDDTHIKDPGYYNCPFRIFDGGAPVTNELGEVMYCDVEGVRCPSGYFCSYGYDDNRSVCCHILGV
ncbi:hypothetical protein ACF0H5_014917 [Mactra antiquata]